MAEVLGTVASVVQVAEVGFSLAATLHKYAMSVKGADKEIKRIAKDVKLTAKVLTRTYEALKSDQQAQLCTEDALDDLEDVLDGCKEAFEEVDSALKKSMKGAEDGKMAVMEKLKWPLRSNKLEVLRAHLEKLKTSLLLMLTVLAYGTKLTQVNTTEVKVELTVEKLQIEQLAKAKDEATKRYDELSATLKRLELLAINGASKVTGPTTDSETVHNAFLVNAMSLPPVEPREGLARASRGPPDAVSERLAVCAEAVRRLASSIDTATRSWEDHQIIEHSNITTSLKNTAHAVHSLHKHVGLPNQASPQVRAHAQSAAQPPGLAGNTAEATGVDNVLPSTPVGKATVERARRRITQSRHQNEYEFEAYDIVEKRHVEINALDDEEIEHDPNVPFVPSDTADPNDPLDVSGVLGLTAPLVLSDTRNRTPQLVASGRPLDRHDRSDEAQRKRARLDGLGSRSSFNSDEISQYSPPPIAISRQSKSSFGHVERAPPLQKAVKLEAAALLHEEGEKHEADATTRYILRARSADTDDNPPPTIVPEFEPLSDLVTLPSPAYSPSAEQPLTSATYIPYPPYDNPGSNVPGLGQVSNENLEQGASVESMKSRRKLRSFEDAEWSRASTPLGAWAARWSSPTPHSPSSMQPHTIKEDIPDVPLKRGASGHVSPDLFFNESKVDEDDGAELGLDLDDAVVGEENLTAFSSQGIAGGSGMALDDEVKEAIGLGLEDEEDGDVATTLLRRWTKVRV